MNIQKHSIQNVNSIKMPELKEEDMPVVWYYNKIMLGIQLTFQDSQNRGF